MTFVAGFSRMRDFQVIVGCGVLVGAQSAASAEQYARAYVGLSAARTTTSQEFTNSSEENYIGGGVGVGFGVALGGVVGNRLIIFMEVLEHVFDESDHAPTSGASGVWNTTSTSMFGLGPGFGLKFDQIGMYASVTFALGTYTRQSETRTSDRTYSVEDSALGVSAHVMVGKQWNVGQEWKLGPALRISAGTFPEFGESRSSHTAQTVSFVFALTHEASLSATR